ncbi:hypothetical protein E4U47_003314 [Claviceps purpurea]|nr:hypothetical protein E4U47_003314 [Claviceps purpurea]
MVVHHAAVGDQHTPDLEVVSVIQHPYNVENSKRPAFAIHEVMIVGLTPNGSERLRLWLRRTPWGPTSLGHGRRAGAPRFSQDNKHHKGYRPVRQGQHTQGGELVANIIHDEVLVDQQSMRLQMEVHTPQQHENAKVKWLNSKNFLGNSTEN